MQISPLHTLQFGLTGHIGKLKGSARSTGEGHFFQIPSHSKKRCPLKACERHNRQTITDCSFSATVPTWPCDIFMTHPTHPIPASSSNELPFWNLRKQSCRLVLNLYRRFPGSHPKQLPRNSKNQEPSQTLSEHDPLSKAAPSTLQEPAHGPTPTHCPANRLEFKVERMKIFMWTTESTTQQSTMNATILSWLFANSGRGEFR